MALLQFFKPLDKGPLDPNGPLSRHVPPSVTASVNAELGKHKETKGKRGEYTKISQEEKAKVARYASENGVTRALRHYKDFELEGN